MPVPELHNRSKSKVNVSFTAGSDTVGWHPTTFTISISTQIGMLQDCACVVGHVLTCQTLAKLLLLRKEFRCFDAVESVVLQLGSLLREGQNLLNLEKLE